MSWLKASTISVCLLLTATLLALAQVASQVMFPPPPNVLLTTVIVGPANPASTDVNNPLGTPRVPRKTIPNPVPPGATVELFGPYATGYSNTAPLRINGTPTAPVVIRAGDRHELTTVSGWWPVSGTHYTIDGLRFTSGLTVLAPNDTATIRDVFVDGSTRLDCSGFGIVSWTPNTWNRRITVFRSRFNDNGDLKSTEVDQDCHGITVNERSEDIWILQSVMARNSGDGIQINSWKERTINRVYVADNVAYSNKQHGFWTKQSNMTVFLRNIAFNHKPSSSSMGGCMGAQYGPEQVWFIENEMWDCDYGIQVASHSGDRDGQIVITLRNRIRNIFDSDGSDKPDDRWQSCALSFMGIAPYFAAIGNIIQNAEAGICVNFNAQVYTANNTLTSVPTQSIGTVVPTASVIESQVDAYYKQVFGLQ